MRNPLFQSMPQKFRYHAYRQCWPKPWRDQSPLSEEENRDLDMALLAYAVAYHERQERNRQYRAERARLAQCPCHRFKSLPKVERDRMIAGAMAKALGGAA